MLAKQGLGIALLGTYVTRARVAVPLELGVRATVQLYAVALAERLESRPVQLAFEWLCETFGTTNPWFRSTLNIADLPVEPPPFGLMLDGEEDDPQW